ncbi:MAG: hypothetical protein IJ880_06495 [Bacilli bacterium]|nr:hypothetical protein [Bacilli bacterium]
MALNDLEKKIEELSEESNIDIEKIKILFEQGANPNALEYDIPEEVLPHIYHWDTLLGKCIWYAIDNNANIFELVKTFIEFGFDLTKYGHCILADFHFITGNSSSDIIELAKLVVESSSEKIDVSEALDDITGTFMCGMQLTKFEEEYLEIYEQFLKAYRDGEDYSAFKKPVNKN